MEVTNNYISVFFIALFASSILTGECTGLNNLWHGGAVNGVGQVAHGVARAGDNILNGVGNVAGHVINGAGNAAGRVVNGAGHRVGNVLNGTGNLVGMRGRRRIRTTPHPSETPSQVPTAAPSTVPTTAPSTVPTTAPSTVFTETTFPDLSELYTDGVPINYIRFIILTTPHS
uniref:Uncharacterized protein n=1 Tax=Latrodectus hesperus TaxID=256737 RepID=E7D1U6_LATHE|nr:hypothetical protein [Latrodectus hesperus]